MVKVHEVKPAVEVYLRNAATMLWVKANFPGNWYRPDSSNIIESVNNTLKLDRELSIVQLLYTIWHKLMGQCLERYPEAVVTGPAILYTRFCTQHLGQSRGWARQNMAVMAGLSNLLTLRKQLALVISIRRTAFCVDML